MDEKLLSLANQNAEYMKKIRRDLHAHPETGFDLERTKKIVFDELTTLGYKPKWCGKAGIIAEIGPEGKETLLLRADMDALPMEEQTDLEFKSTNAGKMHACGHDMHTAMLLGAAKMLKEQESDLKGKVRLCFQPAEEIFQGSLDMMENGSLDSVDKAFMLHVAAGLPMPAGMILVPGGGISMAGCEQFEIVIHGKGGHGSTPSACIDPIQTACLIQIALNEIHSRELPAGSYGVITTGMIQAGAASNIIPDEAVMKGTIRILDEEIRSLIKTRMEEIAKGVAQSMRAEAKVRFFDYCPAMLMNEDLAKTIMSDFSDVFGQMVVDSSKFSKGPGGGSEDFAFVSHKVPAFGVFITAGNSNEGYVYSQHHPKVCFDEKALPMGAAAYVEAANALLS